MEEQHREHGSHSHHEEGGFKPKKIRHKMYGTKTATTEAEYTASKGEGWEDDDEPPPGAGLKQPPK